MAKVMAIGSWIVTVLIAALGVAVGQTIWFYQEPLIDTLPQPGSYFTAVMLGLAALAGSAFVSILATIASLADRGSPSA